MKVIFFFFLTLILVYAMLLCKPGVAVRHAGSAAPQARSGSSRPDRTAQVCRSLLRARTAKEKIMSDIISLRQMQIGQSGRIATVEALGEMGRRIRDMGLIPGTTVSVVGRAPLKDPVALRLSGVTVTLRNSEADHITVDVSN